MVVAKSPDSGTDGPDRLAALSPGPEIMLNLWTSWLESTAKLAGAESAFSRDTPGVILGQTSAHEIAGGLLQGSMRQLGEMLAKDPILRAAEEALKANPLREIIPVDWTEIARALRTV